MNVATYHSICALLAICCAATLLGSEPTGEAIFPELRSSFEPIMPLELGFSSWNLGGPTVTPEQASKKLTLDALPAIVAAGNCKLRTEVLREAI